MQENQFKHLKQLNTTATTHNSTKSYISPIQNIGTNENVTSSTETIKSDKFMGHANALSTVSWLAVRVWAAQNHMREESLSHPHHTLKLVN